MMEDPLYREIILEHWQHPQNYGVVEPADFDAEGSNSLCGDRIRVTGRVTQGVLTEIAFEGEGCAISKASASLFTERVKGMSLDEVRALTADEVLAELGVELTPARTKCALLVHKALLSST
jgi:nitrogen fixation protein NifU and related proteins